jgi:hypothetical protein
MAPGRNSLRPYIVFSQGDEAAGVETLLAPDKGFGWKVYQFDAPGS